MEVCRENPGIYTNIVLAGLEVLRSLNDHGVETEASVEVVVWTNEEGSRFAPAMIGSGAFAACSTLQWQMSDPRDSRTEIAPDISTSLTFQDFIAGRDPAMEAALGLSVAKAKSIARGPPNTNWMRKSR